MTVTWRLARTWMFAVCLLGLGCRIAAAAVDLQVRGVNEQLRRNVIAYLSLARYKDRNLGATMIERLHERIEPEVREALRPFGYYSPVVSSEVSQRDPNTWSVVVHIDPGPPVIMQKVDIRVTGPGNSDPHFTRIITQAPLHVGDRLSHAEYDRIKSDLLNAAANYGYVDARMVRSELRVDPARLIATATLELRSGVRYDFGPTTIDQKEIDDALVRRYIRYRQGEPYDLNQLLRTQFALDDSQYFANVEVQPGDPDHARHLIPVSIHASSGRRDRYQFGGGYGTDTGPRGTLLWDRRLVNGSGDRFSTELEASQEVQQLESQYIVPIGDPALERFAIGATIEQSVPGDLHDKDFSLGPSLTLVRDQWQYVLALLPTHSITEDGYTTQRDNLLVPSVTLGSVPSGYLGEALFERGLTIQLRGADRDLGSTETFLQLHVQGERVFGLGPLWHLLLRGEAGGSLVARGSELPGSFRFFAGGDQSVRGFEYDDLSPVLRVLNPNGTYSYLKVGGRNVLTGTTEVVRDLPRNLGVALFSDFGNAFDTFGQAPNPAYPNNFLEYSVGIGLRWRLPVLTFGIDIAEPISRPGAGPRLHINFSPKL